MLNRKWAWKMKDRADFMREIVAYIVISLAVWGASSWATGVTQNWVNQHVARGNGLRVILVTGAYVVVQAVFFVVKFVIYDKWVFAGRSRVRARSAVAPPGVDRGPREPDPVAEVPALLGAGCVLAAITHRRRHLGQTIAVQRGRDLQLRRLVLGLLEHDVGGHL